MIKLKRCPFCGDEVEIAPTGLYHWKYAIHHKSKTECILDANAFALPYEEEDAARMWNTRADRKTENSSEKPNKSEIPTGSTISKMEQVDRDINVRSKDDPQTCSFSDCDNFKNPDYERCIECKRKQSEARLEDEPQKGEMMTEEEFDSMLARVLTGKDKTQTEREGE